MALQKPVMSTVFPNMSLLLPPAHGSCKTCAHCRLGIAYEKPYLWCRFCNMFFCMTCLGEDAHPLTHQRYIRQLVSRPLYEDGCRTCQTCFQVRQVHIGCDLCAFALCYSCWTDSPQAVTNHVHESMTMFEVPLQSVVPASDPVCTSCDDGLTLLHCDRCSKAIQENNTFKVCKTCTLKYERGGMLCPPCYAEERPSHPWSHQYCQVTVRFIPFASQEEEIAGSWYACMDCDEHLLSLQAVGQHPHVRAEMIIGPERRERLEFLAYNTCLRRGIRPDLLPDPIVPGPSCNRCKNQILWTLNSRVCTTCMALFCNRCVTQGAIRHRHNTLAQCKVECITTKQYPEWWCNLCQSGPYRDCEPRLACIYCPFVVCKGCLDSKNAFRHCHFDSAMAYTWFMMRQSAH